MKVLVYTAVACVLGVVGAILYRDYYEWNHFDPQKTASESMLKVTNAWLAEQRKGRSGDEFWTVDSTFGRTSLFAVRSWEIVDRGLTSVTVRIDSSTRGGTQITKLWKVSFETARLHGDPKIWLVETID
jgi:hypothetical protein